MTLALVEVAKNSNNVTEEDSFSSRCIKMRALTNHNS